MIKYKSTLLNGLTVETVSPNMTEAVTHVEKWYSTYIVKCEIVDSTADNNFISQDWKNITDPVDLLDVTIEHVTKVMTR